ncbi:hypothetical protein tb265_07110 [Gemmatimonadetes bacterium T265]|nr:hypothetical protein tb265_07110 [Gemmatimonadetes bacterium T265]
MTAPKHAPSARPPVTQAVTPSVSDPPAFYPTETMYCIGRPGAMRTVPTEDGERLVAMGYLRPAPDVGPGRWWALVEGVSRTAFDEAMRHMVDEFPRRAVLTPDRGWVTLFDPPTRAEQDDRRSHTGGSKRRHSFRQRRDGAEGGGGIGDDR